MSSESKPVDEIKKDAGLAPVFDYGAITEEHREAVSEVCKFLEQMGAGTNITDEIKVRFGLKTVPEFDLSESIFYNTCTENDIFVACQGHIEEGSGNNAIRYPMVTINGDIRKLDKFFNKILNK